MLQNMVLFHQYLRYCHKVGIIASIEWRTIAETPFYLLTCFFPPQLPNYITVELPSATRPSSGPMLYALRELYVLFPPGSELWVYNMNITVTQYTGDIQWRRLYATFGLSCFTLINIWFFTISTVLPNQKYGYHCSPVNSVGQIRNR